VKRVVLVCLILGCSRSRAVPDAAPPPVPKTMTSAASEAPKLRMFSAADDADALSTIRSARLRSKADARVLVVYVGATWCEPCKRFKNEVASGALDARLARVDMLAFDADRDLERLKAAGYTFHFVPFVALPAAHGGPAEQKEATGKASEAWRDLVDVVDGWQR
jgi:hypothetical protein